MSAILTAAEESANSLNIAIRGKSKNEKIIIKEISSRSKAERQEMKQAYLTMFNKTLEDDLKAEMSGNFLRGTLAMLIPTYEYEAHCLNSAMRGLGTDEKVLIQLICTKESHEIQQLSETYKKIFGFNLDDEISKNLSGDLCRLMKLLISGNRDSTYHVDLVLAQKEAKDLYEAGQGMLGTDENYFIRILCSRSYCQLRATFNYYLHIVENPIEKGIKNEMSGNLKLAFLAIIKSINNLPAYFAEQINESIKGIFIHDKDLIRLIVCRSEIDLAQIKFEYKRMYDKSLYDAVKLVLNGDYQKLILALIRKD